MKLFSAPWCTYCTPVKEYIADNNLDVEVLNIDSPEGFKAAQSAGVKGIPALEKEDGTLMVESQEIIKYLGGL